VKAAVVHICPDCGWPLITGYRPDPSDPDDVEPTAICSKPSCDYYY
jgi:hypothetical protein